MMSVVNQSQSTKDGATEAPSTSVLSTAAAAAAAAAAPRAGSAGKIHPTTLPVSSS